MIWRVICSTVVTPSNPKQQENVGKLNQRNKPSPDKSDISLGEAELR